MAIKTSISIEIEKNGHIFSFTMPSGAPFGEAYDAGYEVLQQIVEFSKKVADDAKRVEEKASN